MGAGPTAARSSAPEPRRCASVEYTRESGYLVFGSSKIRALKVTGSRARALARPRPADAKKRSWTADGFRCRGTRRDVRSIAFVCTRKRMRVTFLWTEK